MDRAKLLFRVHRASRRSWWFSSDGAGRFDLVGVPGRGTCYVAEEPLGAFVEVFRDVTLIDEQDVQRRKLSRLRLPRLAVVADCTRAAARAFGITAALHASESYALTQRWARAFAAAGFAGIRYRVSHDPAQRLLGIALFGPRGRASWPVAGTGPIPASLCDEAERRFGLRVLPPPA